MKTMCARDCPDACFLTADVEEGTIVLVRANKDNPVTNGITCPRAHGDPTRVYSLKRALNPYIREEKTKSTFSLSNWDETLELVSERLKETIKLHGPESVLLLDYAGNTGFITSSFSKRIWNALGVTKTDYTVCSASGHAAINLHYGLSYGNQPEGLLEKKVIIFWGNNAKVSTPHQWALAMQAKRENDAIIIAIDSRGSETTDMADLWLYPKPGTDVALSYGLANYLIEKGAVDSEFIERWTHGYEEYKAETMKWTPERVETTTGVSWEGVKELGDILIEFSPSVFMIGLGLQKSLPGAEAARAVSLLPALLGEHRGFYYTNSMGWCIGGDFSGESLTERKSNVVSMISLGERLARGEFKFIYVFSMNPALTLPDSVNVKKGFLRDDVFVVVHDTHLTETCELANVVLPASTYLEKDDVIVSDCHPYVMLAKKVIEPEGESRDEVWVMREIAKRVGVKESWVYSDPWIEVKSSFIDAFEEGTVEDYLAGKTCKLKSRPMDEYQTPSGRIEFASTSASGEVTALPDQLELPQGPDEYVLLQSADSRYLHTQFRDVYGSIPDEVWMNPVDADRHNLKDGDPITLVNDLGKINLTLTVTEKVQRGVLWSRRELLDEEGNAQNSLVPGTPQRLGGGPMFNSVKVRVL
ncbi:MAG: molybdopterin-dependent oxidoreductase [Candidatus Bathyarchaeota archaeon]|nr:molybdopterin-dependent oxidoreductase [Candidatus Bathyarchaeota archaeon]